MRVAVKVNIRVVVIFKPVSIDVDSHKNGGQHHEKADMET